MEEVTVSVSRYAVYEVAAGEGEGVALRGFAALATMNVHS